MGISPNQAPAIEKNLEEQLREGITVLSGVDIADYNDTEYLKRKNDFNANAVISRTFIQSLQSISATRMLVVWGRIDSYSVKAKRQALFGAKVEGKLRVTINMYSLRFRDHLYMGALESIAELPKPPVPFGNVEKNTHISASDREELSEDLIKQTVEKTSEILAGMVRNLISREGILPTPSRVIQAKKMPSVSDLFDIPSVEAPDVQNRNRRTPKKKSETQSPIEGEE